MKATAQNIANLAIPSQSGQNGKYLTTNGTTTSWGTISGGGKVFVGNILPLSGSTMFLTTTYSTFTNPFADLKTSTEFQIFCNDFNGTEIILLGNFFGNLVSPFMNVTLFSNYASYNSGSKYHAFNLYDNAGLLINPLSDYQANASMQLTVYQP